MNIMDYMIYTLCVCVCIYMRTAVVFVIAMSDTCVHLYHLLQYAIRMYVSLCVCVCLMEYRALSMELCWVCVR